MNKLNCQCAGCVSHLSGLACILVGEQARWHPTADKPGDSHKSPLQENILLKEENERVNKECSHVHKCNIELIQENIILKEEVERLKALLAKERS